MDIELQKLELIKMVMNVETSSLLTEVRLLLSKNISNENETIKKLLEQSQKEYIDGKTESYETILNESKEKYFKQ